VDVTGRPGHTEVVHHTALPQERGRLTRRPGSDPRDLSSVVDGAGGAGGAAERAQVGHGAILPEDGVARTGADNLPRVVHVGNAVLPQVGQEVIRAVAVAVAEPAVGGAVPVGILGPGQVAVIGAVPAGGLPDDLPGVVDAEGRAEGAAQGAQVG